LEKRRFAYICLLASSGILILTNLKKSEMAAFYLQTAPQPRGKPSTLIWLNAIRAIVSFFE